MAAYSALFTIILIACAPGSHEDWRAIFAPQWMRLATFVFFLSLFWHAWVGARDILMDYAKPVGVRLGLEAVAAVVLIAYAGWAIRILWSL
jgi:succinate dehydrogenase / fumarate reductase membrane anchor subunit